MRKLLYLFLFSALSLSVSAQNYQRQEGESAEDFVKRIVEDDFEERKVNQEVHFIHPVIETNWNNKDKKVIIAFWHEHELQGKNSRVTYTIGRMYVPVDNVGTYSEIHIDRVSENPMEAEIQTVFFDDADGDGKRELVVLYSWNYKHYQMAGTFYGAYVYDAIDYNKLPTELTIIDYLDGGIDGNNDANEIMTPRFTTAAGVKTYLDEKGRKPNDTFFRKSFAGKIGKSMDVEFYLERNGDNVSGFYYYKKRGFDIYIYGKIENDSVKIKETDNKGNTTAFITGQFTPKGFLGEWKNAKTNKTYPVNLKQLDYYIGHQPYIEGEYTAVIGCDMDISIKKDGLNYTYTLKAGDREESGTVSLSRQREDNKNIIYITFDDFKWADYKGNLMNVEDTDEVPSTDMYGLDGYWYNGNITIQNSGNAMNYYVKIDECDSKYIQLERVKK